MSDHFHRKCRSCGVGIRMLKCRDGKWRAFDYPEGDSSEWEIHNKGGTC